MSFAYNWLSVCGVGSRLGAEPVETLQVTVLGNPVVGETVEVDVRGAGGQPLQVQVVDGQGRSVSETNRKEPGLVERLELQLGRAPGLYLLRVSVPGQSQTVKILKE